MSKKAISASLILVLTGGVVLLPVVLAVLWAVSALLGALGDTPASRAMGYVGIAMGVIWAVDLVALVVLQSLNSLHGDDGNE